MTDIFSKSMLRMIIESGAGHDLLDEKDLEKFLSKDK